MVAEAQPQVRLGAPCHGCIEAAQGHRVLTEGKNVFDRATRGKSHPKSRIDAARRDRPMAGRIAVASGQRVHAISGLEQDMHECEFLGHQQCAGLRFRVKRTEERPATSVLKAQRGG